MKNTNFETTIELYKRSVITKETLVEALKRMKLTDEQAIILFDLEVWDKSHMKAHFQL